MLLKADLLATIHGGVDYLLWQNSREYSEAAHILTLPVGLSDGVVYQAYTAGLFQRMLILDSLLDCAQFDDRIDKAFVEKEIMTILLTKHRNVGGGWSYIPELPWLPPDADDLGLVIQLLARTGGKSLVSVCDEALKILFKYQTHPDGSFETWIIDPIDRSLLAMEMREYIRVIGGHGASPEVVANLLFGLILYDAQRFQDQLLTGVRYLVASQTSDGFWQSKWYWGRFYGTFRAVMVLSALKLESEVLARTRSFLCQTQLPDGGWGEMVSEPLSTSLALHSLAMLPNCSRQVLEGCLYLYCQQSGDGSWDSVPFIKLVTTDGELSYQSRTITTALCVQALSKLIAENSKLAAIEFDHLEFPYRRDIDRLSIHSDENGRWILTQSSGLLQGRIANVSPCLPGPGVAHHKLPSLHIIEMSTQCNLMCKYCAASAQPTSYINTTMAINPNILTGIVKFIIQSSADNFCVEFQGGEALLNFTILKYFVETINSEAYRVGKYVSFNLVSNLTLLTPAIADYLAANHIAVSTSVDGIEILHNRYRRSLARGQNYVNVLHSINELRSRGVIVGVLMVVTPAALNVPEQIVDNFKQLSFNRFALNPVAPLGRAAQNRRVFDLDPVAYSYFYQRVLRRCLIYVAQGISIWDRDTELLIRKIILGDDPGYPDLASPCGLVSGQIAYDLQGNIYPCDMARFNNKIVLGNVLHHTFTDILHHPDAEALSQASRVTDEYCGQCAYRPWCGRCPVEHQLRFGCVNVPSVETYHCQIWKGIFDRFFEVLEEDSEGMRLATALIRAYV